MPFIQVHAANLYYETYGKTAPEHAPIILIHGATSTGHSDWQYVAPLLARGGYHVIVPDCRGHGQSRTPQHSYSFTELAADTAGLVRALGYARAHVIGHSNGGNVALVTLLEHPDVVQTAILQAANAYVSPDLVTNEPSKFDPDRVAREAPDWVRDMSALHSSVHGPEYWRDLLVMTVQETMAEPNYTPEALSHVARPTFVIQGARDTVNAQSHHAEFIAHHIPNAELWTPTGVGHNVHFERLHAWVKQVLDFLTRRGDAAHAALYRLKHARYADARACIFEVKVNKTPADNGRGQILELSGQTLTEEARQAAIDAVTVASQHAPVSMQVDALRVLLCEHTPWTLVNRAVTDLRKTPSRTAERLSQARIGETARILEARDEWLRVHLVRDGYLGWMRANALQRCTAEDVRTYYAAREVLVQAELATAYDAPGGCAVGKLPFAVAVPVNTRRDNFVAVSLPDGRVWWLKQSDVLPLAQRPRPDAAGIAHTLSLIRRFVGLPYLWGGRTPWGYDCSGLAQTFWGFMDVSLPRDADQQMLAGVPVADAPQPGDLLFFGDLADAATFKPQRVTHVAISLGGDDFIHANGTAGGISYNSRNPSAPNYRAWLRDHLLGVRRPNL